MKSADTKHFDKRVCSVRDAKERMHRNVAFAFCFVVFAFNFTF